jgi:hypothetical protein
MAEPIEYSDEKERRFALGSASTSDRDLASGQDNGEREAARGVASTSSSTAEPLPLPLFRPK